MTLIVRRPLRVCVRTLWISFAMGAATCRGQVCNRMCATLSARLVEPKKPASAVKKIRNGNSEVRIDRAMWLAMANRHLAISA